MPLPFSLSLVSCLLSLVSSFFFFMIYPPCFSFFFFLFYFLFYFFLFFSQSSSLPVSLSPYYIRKIKFFSIFSFFFITFSFFTFYFLLFTFTFCFSPSPSLPFSSLLLSCSLALKKRSGQSPAFDGTAGLPREIQLAEYFYGGEFFYSERRRTAFLSFPFAKREFISLRFTARDSKKSLS